MSSGSIRVTSDVQIANNIYDSDTHRNKPEDQEHVPVT